MERHRGEHHRYPEHQHSNFYQHHTDQNQFNNHSHYNYDSNQQMSGEVNEPLSGGVFRSNGRKRGRFHSPDYGDGGVNAKLYIAPIPRTTTEENIRTLFEEHGSVIEVILPWDKWTGQQQAYCFVKYATFEEADRAIRALHNQHTIPGEVVPIKVRYADGERERPGGFVDKLYVGSVNKQASKQEIEEIFSPYGHVEDVYIARDELKQSRGCAFVKFPHRDMALAAIKGLNGTFTMRGCDQPLIVRFADPKKPKTGELRGSYAFGGPNFGPCSQQPMFRPAPNHGDSMGGFFLPNASFSMQQASTTGVPQAVAHAAKQEIAAPRITEQPLSSVKHPPSQSSQMPLQHTQVPEKCFQSPQQAIFDAHKQNQILEQQQNTQIAPQEPTWTGNTPEPASHNSVTSAVPSSPQMVDPEECDWSEHSCPDGYKYYYNCITCESRWEKPVEFTLFQQQFQEQQKLHGSNQQSSLSPVCAAEEVDETQKVLLEMRHLHQKLQQSSLSVPISKLLYLDFYIITSTVLLIELLTTNQRWKCLNSMSFKSVARNLNFPQ